MQRLMVVESPNKIKKLEAILGAEWKVMASYGHVRDLPPKDLGIDLDDFGLTYEYLPPVKRGDKTFPGSAERVAAIKKQAKGADRVYLASDPDREGEAISWHLREAMGLAPGQYVRVTFGEIMGAAVRASVESPREIDMQLVDAQQARRALDRMVGWLVSPVLSDVLGRNVSAGRVQSLVVRLIVDRERAIRAFKPVGHFGAMVSFAAGGDGKAGWSAAWDTGPHLGEGQQYVLDEALAGKASQCRRFEVLASEGKDARQAPPSPFSTALLLQAASAKLKLTVAQVEKAAQKLYEDGFVNYIRTDSVNLSAEAVPMIRAYAVEKGFAVPAEPRKWKEDADAQEGHEAIRPISMDVEEAGSDDVQRAVYKLIRDRTLASQIEDARYRVNTVRLRAVGADEAFEFDATGRVMTLPGWRAVAGGDAVEAEAEEAEPANAVPVLDVGAIIDAVTGEVQRKKTQAPARYTESTLVKKLKNEGVGRPSTLPAIINTIQARGYVELQKRQFVPTSLGEMVTDVLVRAGFSFMEVDFTRQLEGQLDAIARGAASYGEVVGPAYRLLIDELAKVGESGEFAPAFKCPKCAQGLRMFSGSAARSAYWRCVNTEGCGHFMDDKDGKPVERAVHPCPRCATPLRRYRRKSGVGHLWACPADECNTLLDDNAGKPVAIHKCGKCGTVLRRFQKKNRDTGRLLQKWGWFCPNEEGGCKNFLDDKDGVPVPVPVHPCPACGKAMHLRSGEHGKFWGCSGYRDGCKTVMDDKGGKPVPKGAAGAGGSARKAGKGAGGKASPAVVRIGIKH